MLYTALHILYIGSLVQQYKQKLDGVGPIENQPSTDKLHHFVHTKKCDMWHVNILSKFQLPSLSWFVIYDILKIRRKRLTKWMNHEPG